MAEENKGRATKTKVCSSNRGKQGIGFEICRQLASHGLMVILTARNGKRGRSFGETQAFGLAENVVFQQLDVMDPSSIASLSEFIKAQFDKLDILVNNAGIDRVNADADALRAKQESSGTGGSQVNWNDMTQTYEKAKECLETNYYGVKRMTETFIPLQLSKSPRIVNVSSSMGKLKEEGVTEKSIEGIVTNYELTKQCVETN